VRKEGVEIVVVLEKAEVRYLICRDRGSLSKLYALWDPGFVYMYRVYVDFKCNMVMTVGYTSKENII
jgi:hypothetical protein